MQLVNYEKDEMKQTPSSPVSTVMQESFGCAVENRFYQLLDDESDPFDLLYQAGVDKTSSKKDATTAKKNTNQKANKKESQKNRKASIVPFNQEPIVAPQTGQKRAPKYGEKIGQNENLGSEIKVERAEQRTAFREFRPNIIQKPLEYSIEKPVENFDKDRQIRNVGSIRGGMRGRGRGGFQRNTDFDNQRGKREFERHSGSDRSIRAEDKRGGSGPHNWGSIKDDFSEIEQTAVEDQKDSNETQEPTEEPVKMEEEIDEVAQEMTLDEWKSIQEQSRPKPDFNLRKPDTVVPSKAVVIHKAKYRDNLKEDEDYQYCFRKPVNDITSQLDINFGSLTRPSRGRGGGRGRARKEETFTHEIVNILSTAPNPDDPEDFPALI
ncbi:intracellular hyaluronan-binding protein 4 isoform X2 [Bombina bombina]|uniref:intracellular hyaluronan-binding protein 4 isoform X2 n=1 Tax=Bombina bombina TaxID=8345 RepID=UPI00235ADE4C|nr:intracellular hyaluronan-binding protein 4 isoform X2 [Bombina bombina]